MDPGGLVVPAALLSQCRPAALPGGLARGRRDEVGRCQAWRLRAAVHWLQADSAAAEDAWRQAAVHARLAGLYAMQDRIAEAGRLLARGMAAFEELGVTMTSSVTHPASFVAMLAGDPATAEAHLRRDYEGLEAMGEKGYLAAGGRLAEAEELARSAVALAARTDFLNQHGDALLELAVVLDKAGRAAEARVAVTDALGLYGRKGDLLAAARARRRLERLAPA